MRCDLLGGWRHDALACCPQCAPRGETRTRTKYLFFRSPLFASTLPTRIASERIDGRHVTAGQGVEPVCRAAAAGRRRGASRPVAGRFVAPARDRPAARPLPPARRYVMVRLAARGGTAGVDGHAAVAAGGALARVSGRRDAQPLRRAMAPSPPTGAPANPARWWRC